jgi:hypothetical protein
MNGPMPTPQEVIVRLLNAVNTVIAWCHMPIRVEVSEVDGQPEVHLRVMVQQSSRVLGAIKEDIRVVIHKAGHHLTGDEVRKALQENNMPWGDTSVDRAHKEMVDQGVLDNSRRVRPRGYGLPEWQGRAGADAGAGKQTA